MLALSRKPQESVTLFIKNCDSAGDTQIIRIIVGKTRGKATQIIFDAPESVKIMRTELLHLETISGASNHA